MRVGTLFVVGAGASKEVDLPTGNELKQIISNRMDLRFEARHRLLAGDPDIVEALRVHAHQLTGNPNISEYQRAAWLIRDAMPQAISIDNFLDAHRGNDKVEVCGKLAIVQSILQAERKSSLYLDVEDAASRIDYLRVENSWYVRLMRILTEGIRTSDVHRIFGNVSFICFNYDRCIEHYFFYALQNYYGIKAEEAQQIMRSVPIVHPYGRVGPLPWEPSGGVSFGAKLTAPGLLEVTQQIRTFTEEARDENLGLEIQRLIDQAEVIVFLGCAYHSLNLQILKSPKERQSTEILGTARGISDSNVSIIQADLQHTFKAQSYYCQLRRDLSCSAFFDEYSRRLAKAIQL